MYFKDSLLRGSHGDLRVYVEGVDGDRTPPRHGDVDDRAEEEEEDELGDAAFDNVTLSLRSPAGIHPRLQ